MAAKAAGGRDARAALLGVTPDFQYGAPSNRTTIPERKALPDCEEIEDGIEVVKRAFEHRSAPERYRRAWIEIETDVVEPAVDDNSASERASDDRARFDVPSLGEECDLGGNVRCSHSAYSDT